MAYFKVLGVTLLAALVSCEPPVSGYNYQPPRNYQAPSNNYLPPTPSYSSPSNNYLPPSSFSSGPGFSSPSHSLSAPSHGLSAPSHGLSASGHGASASGYGASASGYGASASGYGASASGYGSTGGHHGDHGHGHGGEHEVPKSYEFGYAVKDAVSGNDYDRRESSDGNVVRGEYRVQLPDGRTQIVTYHADWQTGFHADVRYEGEARYPEPAPQVHQQGGYNYNAPPKDFQGSLTGFHGNSQGYQPSPSYGPPGYH